MKSSFRWRQSENQPSVTRVHGCKSEDIPEERAVGLRVLAVQDYVRTGDHNFCRCLPPNIALVPVANSP